MLVPASASGQVAPQADQASRQLSTGPAELPTQAEAQAEPDGPSPSTPQTGPMPDVESTALPVEVEAQTEPAGQPASFDPEELQVDVEGPDRPVLVGDLIPIWVRTTLPPGIQLKSVIPEGAGRLEQVDVQTTETLSAEGRQIQVTLLMTTYRPGLHAIERFTLRVADVQDTTYERRLPGLQVRVNSLIANQNDPALRPEKGGVPVMYRDYTLAWVAGIGASLLAMVGLGFLIARSWPRTTVAPPPPPPRPAHEVALEKLDRIAKDQLIERGMSMEFYVRLSETLREYLGARYGQHALEMTTTEIMGWLEGIALGGQVTHELVAHLLYECDLVKFAKYGTGEEDQREALDNGYLLVQETMVTPLPSLPDDVDQEIPLVDRSADGSTEGSTGEGSNGGEEAGKGAKSPGEGSIFGREGLQAGEPSRDGPASGSTGEGTDGGDEASGRGKP